MAVISDLEYERNKYCNLRDSIKEISTELNSNINSITQIEQNLAKNLLLDNEKYENKQLTNKKEELKTIHDNLINRVMPAINQKINSINSTIKELESIMGV